VEAWRKLREAEREAGVAMKIAREEAASAAAAAAWEAAQASKRAEADAYKLNRVGPGSHPNYCP
jgi:hypothetical protein